MTLFCSPAVLLCLLAMVDPAAACFPLFLPKTLALPSFHCFSHLFHCYCLIVLTQDLGTAIPSLFFSSVSLLLLHCFAPDLGIVILSLFFSFVSSFLLFCIGTSIPLLFFSPEVLKAFSPQTLLSVYVLRPLFSCPGQLNK